MSRDAHQHVPTHNQYTTGIAYNCTIKNLSSKLELHITHYLLMIKLLD